MMPCLMLLFPPSQFQAALIALGFELSVNDINNLLASKNLKPAHKIAFKPFFDIGKSNLIRLKCEPNLCFM